MGKRLGVLIVVDTPSDEYGGGMASACSVRDAVQSVNQDSDFGGCEDVSLGVFSVQGIDLVDGKTAGDGGAILFSQGSWTSSRCCSAPTRPATTGA